MDLDLPENEMRPFIDRRLYLKKIENLGYGVFAKEDIKENKFIEIAPVVVCEKEEINYNLSNYIVSWNGKLGFPLGWTMLYNHSDQNSCDFLSNYHESWLAILTNRKINKGEQVTVNYGLSWFSSRSIKKI